MATIIEFEVDGFEQVTRRWDEIGDRARNARPAFRAMVRDFRRKVRLEFASEGAYEGGTWEQLRPSYLEERLEEGRGSAILRLYGGMGGRLFESLVGENNWAVEDIADDHMEVGTKLGIARVHQTGGTRTIPEQQVTIRRGPAAGTSYVRRASTHRIPARPFTQIDRRDLERWAGFVRRWIVDGIAPRGVGE